MNAFPLDGGDFLGYVDGGGIVDGGIVNSCCDCRFEFSRDGSFGEAAGHYQFGCSSDFVHDEEVVLKMKGEGENQERKTNKLSGHFGHNQISPIRYNFLFYLLFFHFLVIISIILSRHQFVYDRTAKSIKDLRSEGKALVLKGNKEECIRKMLNLLAGRLYRSTGRIENTKTNKPFQWNSRKILRRIFLMKKVPSYLRGSESMSNEF